MEIENSKSDEQSDEKKYEIKKRRELMADGRRYIIYYTFGKNAGEPAAQSNAPKPSAENAPVKSEEN